MIVVMTQRDKIGMEALFRRIIPLHKRYGSQFVFRQVLAHSLTSLKSLFSDVASS